MAMGSVLLPSLGATTLKTLNAPSASIANTETIVFQYLVPANLLRVGDRLRLWFTESKSGTTDIANMRVRLGAAGTTADALLFSAGVLAATSRAGGWILDFKLVSATTIQQLGSSNTGQVVGYGQIGAPAFPAAVTITDASANALYLSVGVFSSSTNDTVALQDAHLQIIPATP